LRTIDTKHLGRERIIASYLLDGCLIDCGPATVVDTLVAELGDERPRRLLVTHIHLDHSGGAGTLVERWPDLEVWVHERGAPHLVDPSKLLASAGRLYGDDLERLWGQVVPVPERNLRVLRGGETIDGWRVAYTPGHASHHVSYLHEATGTAFPGDVAGVRIPPDGPVLAPTPPPDIDLEAWARSIDTLAAWRPERLAVTHFGVWEDPEAQLAELREALDRQVAWARELPDPAAFGKRVRSWLRSRTGEDTFAVYEAAAASDHLYPGLERALRRVSSPQA
jgi:glyoxylase-like metal-dependent hydrolase (beta-lactamase superfamily II)